MKGVKNTELLLGWLLDHTEEPFLFLDRDLSVVSFNEELRRRYQDSFDLAIRKGDSFPEYALPGSLNQIRETCRQVLEGTEAVYEITIPHSGKKESSFFIKQTPVRDSNGEIVGIFILMRDISEKIEARKQQEFEKKDKEALINNSPALMWSVSRDLTLIAANKAFAKSLEKQAGAVWLPGTKLELKEGFSPDYLALWQDLYDKALSGESFNWEIFTPPRGTVAGAWSEVSFNPIYDEGRISGIACYSRDITASKDFESTLIDINSKLETAQQIAQLGYWELDLDLRNLFCSRQLYHILGVSPETHQFTYRNFHHTIHPDDRALFDTGRKLSMLGQGNLDVEHRIILPDGSVKYVHTRGDLVAEDSGRPAHFEGTIQDITQRKLVEEQLQRLNQALQEQAADLAASNADLEQFAYVASHDLQEPLRMVSSFLQLLERKYKDRIDDTASEYIRFAVDGAERMKKLILDLLEYSRSGTDPEGSGFTDMNEVIKDVRAILKHNIEELDAVLETDPLPVLVPAGKSRMLQLMQNLVSNALKYHGSEKPHIRIGFREEPTQWVFSVQDNGIGIDPRYTDKIFVIFQRLHSKNEYSGTGIGLSICKKIVERHGGKIWVESARGAGSTFYFSMKKTKQPG